MLAAATGVIGVVAAPPASAEVVSGWIGAANANSINYLHQSTINTDPFLNASAAVWTPFGQPIPINAVGINSRLFKSGVLCDATDYIYNGYTTVNYSVATGDPDCGPGSYNSHALARLFNGTGYNTITTFPTSPINFGAAARSAGAESGVEAGALADGRTTGTAEGVESDADLPDLVAAYADNGEKGWVSKADLTSPALSEDEVAALPAVTSGDGNTVRTSGTRTIPVYANNGVDVIGEFEIR